jgi:preprotein translocase subunit SecF
MFDFVGKRYWFFLFSAILIAAGIIFLSLGGLKLGIEFQGGSSLRLHFDEEVDVDQSKLEQVLSNLGYEEATVQKLEAEEQFLIRTRILTSTEEEKLKDDLKEQVGDFGKPKSQGIVSAMVAKETMRNAGIAVAVAAVAILLYVTWAFRKMPSPFRYGTCSIIALIHDVFITIGIFSILGWALHWEVNPMFITAVLAVIGYSVNDTIVIFDRIRENLTKGTHPDFGTTVNASLTQTLTRSLNTSITTILVVLALYLFVGGNIRNFVVALLIGVVAGTYSSIFIASQLLVVWERGEWKRFVPPIPLLRRLRT